MHKTYSGIYVLGSPLSGTSILVGLEDLQLTEGLALSRRCLCTGAASPQAALRDGALLADAAHGGLQKKGVGGASATYLPRIPVLN